MNTLEIILNNLDTPLRLKDLEEITDIPKTTLHRNLKSLVDNKMIKYEDTFYIKLKPVPNVAEIYDTMNTFHQQKLMDWKYRKLKKQEKIDYILNWYIDKGIKHKISEYHEHTLETNILIAYNTLKNSISVIEHN